MTDTLRERILLEALTEIPVTGFTDAALSNAAARTGLSKREILDAFPHGPASLVEAFLHWADARMAEMQQAREAEKRIRDRIASAVRARIEVLAPHKEAARRAAAFLAQPQNTMMATRLTLRTVDAMWRACGDRSSDFSYYTKRATLAGVYATTLAYWFSDSSEGNQATWTFLGHRIDNVMQFEKFKRDAQDALAKIPGPLKFFDALRRGNSR